MVFFGSVRFGMTQTYARNVNEHHDAGGESCSHTENALLSRREILWIVCGLVFFLVCGFASIYFYVLARLLILPANRWRTFRFWNTPAYRDFSNRTYWVDSIPYAIIAYCVVLVAIVIIFIMWYLIFAAIGYAYILAYFYVARGS